MRLEAFDAIFGLDGVVVAGVYVQQIAQIGDAVLGRTANP